MSCEKNAGVKWLTFLSLCHSERLHPVIQRSPSACPRHVARMSSPKRQRKYRMRGWYQSVGQEIRAWCITHPSDKWAQHELIKTGQKNSTFHRSQGCGWLISTEYPSCFNQEEKDEQPGHYIFFRSEPVLQKCTVQAVPSILFKLIQYFLWALRFRLSAFSSAQSCSYIRQFKRRQVGVQALCYPHFVPQHHTHANILLGPLLQRHLPSAPPPATHTHNPSSSSSSSQLPCSSHRKS